MPVLEQTPVISYVANGSVTSFAFPFQILYASDLQVYVDAVLTTTGFTVSGVGSASGGSVTFTVAPTNGSVVRLVRVTKMKRTTDYVEGGNMTADTLDTDFDRTVMMIQEVSALTFHENAGGNLDATNRRIVNVADPINPSDAVSRGWAETSVSSQIATALNAATSATASAASAASSAASSAAAAAAAAHPWAFVGQNIQYTSGSVTVSTTNGSSALNVSQSGTGDAIVTLGNVIIRGTSSGVNASTTPYLELRRYNSSSVTDYTTLDGGFDLGGIKFRGTNGTASVEGARIYAENGSAIPWSSTNTASQILFKTCAINSTSLVDSFSVDAGGGFTSFGNGEVQGDLYVSSNLNVYGGIFGTGGNLVIGSGLNDMSTSIGGGSSGFSDTGAWIACYGNSHSSYAGDLRLRTGAGTTGQVLLQTGTTPTTRTKWTEDGAIHFGIHSSKSVGDNSPGITFSPNNYAMFYRDSAQPVFVGRTGTTTTGAMISFYTGSTAAGSISVTTSGGTPTFVAASDYRLKHEVRELNGCLDRILGLLPKTYRMIADPEQNDIEGFIAHEYKEQMPKSVWGEKDAVDEEGNPVYQSIELQGLLPVIVGAIKELTERVVAIETKLNPA